MKTSNLGNVAVGNSSHPRKKFDWTHDVNTTCEWGAVQPLMCRLIPAGSKSKVSTEQLIRFAPLVVPTFGRVKVKNWHYFVAMSDLSQNFASLMAERSVSRSQGYEFVPKKVPHMPLGVLSWMIFFGAKLTIYRRRWGSSADGDLPASGESFVQYEQLQCNKTNSNHIWDELYNVKHILNTDSYDMGYNHLQFNFLPLLPASISGGTTINGQNFTTNDMFKIPLSNPSGNGLWGFVFDVPNSASTNIIDWNGVDVSNVPLESADEVITYSWTDSNNVKQNVAFAFRLSAFGKRLKKILQGCGYQIDFMSEADVSVLPLLAYYKAYFDVFGLLLYDNWENTPAAKLLNFYDCNNFHEWRYLFQANQDSNHTDNDLTLAVGYWFNFIKDLGATFYTDSQDYVSAHTTVIAPQTYKLSSKFKQSFVDVKDSANANEGSLAITDRPQPGLLAGYQDGEVFQGMSGGIPYYNNHAFIDRVFHGQLDSEVLLRLYRCTNRNTIAGARVRELCLMQGLGDFLDNIKPNFIGYSEFDPSISDVVSMSDTYDPATKSGSQLGEQGAKGMGYDRSKNFSFENSEPGYWITLSVVMPQGGYCQAVDQTVKCVEKFDFYQPEFDGVGPEVTAKDAVVGALDWHSMSNSGGSPLSSKGFGFIPRYSGLKVKQNVLNGDFALRSKKDAYAPYTLDRLIKLNERRFSSTTDLDAAAEAQGVTRIVRATPVFLANSLPCAGNLWRYVTRYAWLAHFDRIFSYAGDDVDKFLADWKASSYDGTVTSQAWEYVHNGEDNFMLHNLIRFDCFAPMLPISDSFETLEDGNNGKVSTNISKA